MPSWGSGEPVWHPASGNPVFSDVPCERIQAEAQEIVAAAFARAGV
ncbi:MAG: hypothetical protein AAF845_14680 [Bacteroidota bacterium]